MRKAGKYLVTVDANEASRVALNFACKKAVKNEVAVEALYVITPEEGQTMFGVMDKMREERKKEAEILLKSLANAAFQYAGVTPTVQIREGRLGEEIINAALEDANITLLVIGTAARSSGKKLLINWLAEKLGDRLLIPMMVVPGNLTDLQMDMLS